MKYQVYGENGILGFIGFATVVRTLGCCLPFPSSLVGTLTSWKGGNVVPWLSEYELGVLRIQ